MKNYGKDGRGKYRNRRTNYTKGQKKFIYDMFHEGCDISHVSHKVWKTYGLELNEQQLSSLRTNMGLGPKQLKKANSDIQIPLPLESKNVTCHITVSFPNGCLDIDIDQDTALSIVRSLTKDI